MTPSDPRKAIKARILRIFSWVTGISLGTFALVIGSAILALAIFVRTDTFQNALQNRILQIAKSELGASITFESAKVSLFRIEPKIEFLNVKFEHAPTKTVANLRRISIGMSLFISVPLLFFKELNLSSIEIEGLAYKLESFKVVQKWLDLFRPKYSYLPTTFQTSVGRISLQDVEVTLAVPESGFYSRGLGGIVKLEAVDLRLLNRETEFSGSFSLSNLVSKDFGPMSGTLSLESGRFNASRIRFSKLQLRNGDDFLDISGELKRFESPILDFKGKVSAKLENLFEASHMAGVLATDFAIRGPWEKLEGEGKADLKDIRLKHKHWDSAKAQWSLKYPQLELKSLTWVSGEERGEIVGQFPLEKNQQASLDVKLDKVDLGPTLGLVAPGLVRWRGATTGNIHYSGTLYPEIKGKFDWKLHLSNYQIRSAGHDTYSFGLPELDLNGAGNFDGVAHGDFTASLAVGDHRWTGGGRWTPNDFDLTWDAVLRGGDFGELLARNVKAAGTLHGNLSGPWRDLVMRVEPKFTEFIWGDQRMTNLKGNLVLENRVLAGLPLVCDQVSVRGGIYFPSEGPEEFSDVKLDVRSIDSRFLFDILGVHVSWINDIGAHVAAQGFLKGPLSQPIGSGSVRFDDWTWKTDSTKGRIAKAKWAAAGGDLYLDTMELKLSSDGEPLIGEMSFDPNGIVGFSLEGMRIRASDFIFLVDPQLSIQGFGDISLDYQRQSPSLHAKIKLFETTIAGTSQPDSNFEANWIADRMEFSGNLFGGALDLSGVSTQKQKERETSAKFKVNNFNLASVIRGLSNSRLEMPIDGTGAFTFRQMRTESASLLTGLFLDPGDYQGEVKVLRASIQRGASVLQSIDPFTVKIGGTQAKVPRLYLSAIRIRSLEKLLEVNGFYESGQSFLLEMKGVLDLRAFAALYPPFSRSEGLATLDGAWTPAGFSGKIRISEGLIAIQNSPLVIRNVVAELRGEGHSIDLKTLKGDFREGGVSASGRLEIGAGDIQSAQFLLQLENTLLQPQQGFSFRASGPLSLKIKGKEGELSGRLAIRDGVYRRRLDIKTDILKILSTEKVSFKAEDELALWKVWKLNILFATDTPFTIRNNLAEGSANLNINLLGTLGEPKLKGSIGIVRGDFYYHNRQFTISSGSIQFVEQVSNIPLFDIRADTEVSDYRISVQILGDANDQKIKYSSEPPLKEKDILSLVSFGYRASDGEIKEQDPTRSASFTGISFVTGKLQDRIEGGLSSNLGIRRFQLVPSYYDQTGKTELQMTVGMDVVRNKIEMNYSSFLSAAGGQKVELEYKVARNFSLIGSWRNMPGQNADDFGGDFRFRFEFE